MNLFEVASTVQLPEESQSQKAFTTIKAYIDNEELVSVRFQAFSDYADLQSAHLLRTEGGVYNKALIQETIRQRINGVSGYQIEHEKVQRMVSDYEMAIKAKYPDQHVKRILSNRLTEIKDRHIGRTSQSLLQTPKR